MPCLGRHCKLKHVLALLSLSISAWVSTDGCWEIRSWFCVQNDLKRGEVILCETVQKQIISVPNQVKWFKIIVGFYDCGSQQATKCYIFIVVVVYTVRFDLQYSKAL